MPNCVLSIFSRDMWLIEEEETDFIHDLNNSSSNKIFTVYQKETNRNWIWNDSM